MEELINNLAELWIAYQPDKEDNNGHILNNLFKAIAVKYSLEPLDLIRKIKTRKDFIKSIRGKRKRIKQKLLLWQKEKNLYFVTLTFNDNYLSKTTEETRRRDIKDTLNATSEVYIANQDFGKDRGREHYHALCGNLRPNDLKRIRKDMGFVDCKKITSNLGGAVDYAMKLSNHSLKDTTNKKIIYSRPKKRDGIDITNEG